MELIFQLKVKIALFFLYANKENFGPTRRSESFRFTNVFEFHFPVQVGVSFTSNPMWMSIEVMLSSYSEHWDKKAFRSTITNKRI